MARHVENARAVASFLRADPRVAWVDYVAFLGSPVTACAQISRRPRYAWPLFRRLASEIEKTETFKPKRSAYVAQGFRSRCDRRSCLCLHPSTTALRATECGSVRRDPDRCHAPLRTRSVEFRTAVEEDMISMKTRQVRLAEAVVPPTLFKPIYGGLSPRTDGAISFVRRFLFLVGRKHRCIRRLIQGLRPRNSRLRG